MITFYVPFLWQKLIYSRKVRHFFPFLNPELCVKTLAQELALKISWSTKSNSIECDSSHLYLKRRWRKSALNEYQENLCVIFEEEFILVQKFFENCLLYLKNKMKMTGSAFISDKAARCGSTFFCAIFINHRWRIIWPNLCDWPKFET